MYPFVRTVLGCVALAICSHSASAAIIINTDQSASGSLGTVNLPGGATGLMIQGTANGGALLNFTGQETLISPSSGQARIEAVDGGFLTLDMRFAGGQLFDRFVFNLDATVTDNVTGNVTVQAYNQVNLLAATQVIALSGAGQNFINVLASGGDHISAVSFITTAPVAIENIAQVRVNAILGGPDSNAVVPEPASFGMMGIGLLGLGLFIRKKRSA